jgi:hypothetical protein
MTVPEKIVHVDPKPRRYGELAVQLVLAPVAVLLATSMGAAIGISPRASALPVAIVAVGFVLVRGFGLKPIFLAYLLGSAWLAAFRGALRAGGDVPTPLGMLWLVFFALAFSALLEIGVRALVRKAGRRALVGIWSVLGAMCIAAGIGYVIDRRDDYRIAEYLPYSMLSDFRRMDRLVSDPMRWNSEATWLAELDRLVVAKVARHESLDDDLRNLVGRSHGRAWTGVQLLLRHGANIHHKVQFFGSSMSAVEYAVDQGNATALRRFLDLEPTALTQEGPDLVLQLCSSHSYEVLALLQSQGMTVTSEANGGSRLLQCVVGRSTGAHNATEMIDVVLGRPLVMPAHYSSYSQQVARRERANAEARLARWRAAGPAVHGMIVEESCGNGTITCTRPLFWSDEADVAFVMHLLELGARCAGPGGPGSPLAQFCHDYAAKLDKAAQAAQIASPGPA